MRSTRRPLSNHPHEPRAPVKQWSTKSVKAAALSEISGSRRSGRGDPRGLVAVVGRIAPWGTHGQTSETKSAVTQWEVRSRKWAQGREGGDPLLEERLAEAPADSVLNDQPRNED